jgi:amidase
MDLDDLLVRPATEVAALLRNRAVSSRELTEAALRRIERLDPLVNAVVVTCADEALAAAGRADAAVAAGAAGALLGLPITVKEAIDVAGLPTTWGNPAFVSHVATTDATVVARLRDAGAIVVGKTNAHAMLGDFGQTFNDVYGATANPWDGSRTPGGSSGGSAAAVAMGFGFLDHGSDLVGSIRIPASFCGVFGLRPSVGVVPLTGLAVPGQEREESDQVYLSTLGPLARSPDDLRAALQATGGPDGTERRAYAWSLPAPRHARLADYRVRVVLDDPRVAPTSAVAAAIARAVEAIAASGATLIEGWPEGVEPERSHAAFGYEVRKFFAFQEPDAAPAPWPEIVARERERMALRAAWARCFDDADVFLCPVNFTAAFPHDRRPFDQRTIETPEGARRYDSQSFWVSHAAVPGLPAVAAPIGRTAEGLPVGIQVIGPLYEDDTALTVAELLADITGGYEPPPSAMRKAV